MMKQPEKSGDDEYEYFNKDTLEYYFKKVYQSLIKFEDKLNKIIRLESLSCTIQAIVGLYITSIIVSNICTTLLGFFGFNLLFLAPLAYKFKKNEIDGVCSMIKTNAVKTIEKVESLIPRYVEK